MSGASSPVPPRAISRNPKQKAPGVCSLAIGHQRGGRRELQLWHQVTQDCCQVPSAKQAQCHDGRDTQQLVPAALALAPGMAPGHEVAPHLTWTHQFEHLNTEGMRQRAVICQRLSAHGHERGGRTMRVQALHLASFRLPHRRSIPDQIPGHQGLCGANSTCGLGVRLLLSFRCSQRLPPWCQSVPARWRPTLWLSTETPRESGSTHACWATVLSIPESVRPPSPSSRPNRTVTTDTFWGWLHTARNRLAH